VELRDTFRALVQADDIRAVVIASNGGNFSWAATSTTSSACC
jgi:enoyl-CoA hydratase/carnithine racemase